VAPARDRLVIVPSHKSVIDEVIAGLDSIKSRADHLLRDHAAGNGAKVTAV
jgi:hypothetical protein